MSRSRAWNRLMELDIQYQGKEQNALEQSMLRMLRTAIWHKHIRALQLYYVLQPLG